jgi:PKD repeat protein
MFQTSFTVQPDLTGFVNVTDFTFTDTTSSTATVLKTVWDFGDDTDLVYNNRTPTHTYNYPGTYTVQLTSTDSENNSGIFETNITVDLIYRDWVLFTQIPENYAAPGKKTSETFKVQVLCSSVSSAVLNLDLFAIGSKSIPEQFVSPRWTFLNPTWKFLNTNDEVIYSLPIKTVPIYYQNRVVAVSGEGEFYFVDSQSTGDPEVECPILVTCTLQTSGFSYPKDSTVYPYESYANNKTVKCAAVWHVYNYKPDLLKITSNYIDEMQPSYWQDIKIPFIISAHASRGMKIPGADSSISEILFSHPNDNIIGKKYKVDTGILNLENSNYNVDEAPLYFQATDQINTIVGGYIFTSITPKVSSLLTSISAQTTIDDIIEYTDYQYPNIHTLAPNGFVWISNPERNTLNRITLVPYPEQCQYIQDFKQSQALIDGVVKQIQTSVPFAEHNSTFNYNLTGFSGIYSMAIDPRFYDLIAADAETDRLYKFSSTGKLLSTLELSNLEGVDSVSAAYTPASISLDRDYNIWVSLFNNLSVLKFDKDFNLLFSTEPSGNSTQTYVQSSAIFSDIIVNQLSSVILPNNNVSTFINNLSALTPALSTTIIYSTTPLNGGLLTGVVYTELFDTIPLAVTSTTVSTANLTQFLSGLSAEQTPTYTIRNTEDSLSSVISYTTFYKTQPLSGNFLITLSAISPFPDSYIVTSNNNLTYTVEFNAFTNPNFGVQDEEGFILLENPLTSINVLATDLSGFIGNLSSVSPFPNSYRYYNNNDSTISILFTAISSISVPINKDIFDGDFLLKPPIVETDQNNNCWSTYAHPLCSMIVKYGPSGEVLTQIVQDIYSTPVSLALDVNNDIWVANSYNVLSADGEILRYSTRPTLVTTISTAYNITPDVSASFIENLTGVPNYNNEWAISQTNGTSSINIEILLRYTTLHNEPTLVTQITGIPRPSYLAVDRNNNLWFTYGIRNIGCYENTTGSLYQWNFDTRNTRSVFTLLNAPTLTAQTIALDPLTGVSSDLSPVDPLTGFNLTYDVYTNDEELGGIGVDCFNRIWIVDSYYNKACVINSYDLKGQALDYRIFKIKPDSTVGYWPSFISGTTIEETLNGVKSAQAAGDWTGYKWYQKYINPLYYPTSKEVSGVSIPFIIQEFRNPYEFRKINDSFNTTEYYKSLALPENLQNYATLWNNFFPAVVGDGSNKNNQDLGQTVYEKVANFANNHRDVDTCNVSQLLSLAEETTVPYADYATRLPVDILKAMDTLSVSISRLLGLKNNYPNITASLSSELTTTTLLTAGQKIILKSKKNNTIELTPIPQTNSGATIYPLSALELPGYPTPLSKYYLFYSYNPQYDDYYIENIIDWASPHTVLSPNLSTVEDWYKDGGIAETTFNYLLNKNLFYK